MSKKRRYAAAMLFIAIFATALAAWAFWKKEVSPTQGFVVVQVYDPDVHLRINGEEVEIKDSTSRNLPYNLGKCDIIATKDGKVVYEATEEISSSNPVHVHLGIFVSTREGWMEAVSAKWLNRISKLPPEDKFTEIVAKLKELNPGFESTVKHKIKGPAVVELSFSAEKVTNIAPLAALKNELKELTCKGGNVLADIGPLKGFAKLSLLNIRKTAVKDLAPLQDMHRLRHLYISNTNVHDLSVLKQLRLVSLHVGGTGVSDLVPLQGMLLKDLRIWNTGVSDLAPLKGMPLESLDCSESQVRDFSAIRSIATLKRINGLPATKFWEKEAELRSGK